MLCWAYSCASMLRASCSILIKELFESGMIDQKRREKCLKFIMSEESHRKIRNLLAMLILPKRIQDNDNSDGNENDDSAFIRAAVSRVSYTLETI